MLFIFTGIGCFVAAVVVGHVLWNLVDGFRVHVIGQYVNLKEKYGSWAGKREMIALTADLA